MKEVLAVRGRSAEACATAALEVAGIFPPPSSIFLILVFSSSNSSHTEAAGPVEPCDSVSWCEDTSFLDSDCGVLGSLRENDEVRLEGRYACVAARLGVWTASGTDGRRIEARNSLGESSVSFRNVNEAFELSSGKRVNCVSLGFVGDSGDW